MHRNAASAGSSSVFYERTKSNTVGPWSWKLPPECTTNSRAGFFNILADEDVRQGLKEFSEWPTFPQLYTNGDLVGGLDIVKEEMEADPNFFKPFSTKAEGQAATA